MFGIDYSRIRIDILSDYMKEHNITKLISPLAEEEEQKIINGIGKAHISPFDILNCKHFNAGDKYILLLDLPFWDDLSRRKINFIAGDIVAKPLGVRSRAYIELYSASEPGDEKMCALKAKRIFLQAHLPKHTDDYENIMMRRAIASMADAICPPMPYQPDSLILVPEKVFSQAAEAMAVNNRYHAKSVMEDELFIYNTFMTDFLWEIQRMLKK